MDSKDSDIDFDKISETVLSDFDERLIKECIEKTKLSFSMKDLEEKSIFQPSEAKSSSASLSKYKSFSKHYEECARIIKHIDAELAAAKSSAKKSQKSSKPPSIKTISTSTSMCNLSTTIDNKTSSNDLPSSSSTFKIPKMPVPRKEHFKYTTQRDAETSSLKSFGSNNSSCENLPLFENPSFVFVKENHDMEAIFKDYQDFKNLNESIQKKLDSNHDKIQEYNKTFEKVQKFAEDLEKLSCDNKDDDTVTDAFTREEEKLISKTCKATESAACVLEKQNKIMNIALNQNHYDPELDVINSLLDDVLANIN